MTGLLSLMAVADQVNPPQYVGVPDYPHSVETRRFVGIPSITRASNGRYWATWYASAAPART